MSTAKPSTELEIRVATRADVPLILQFICDLAEYERAPEQAVVTAADLDRDGFGPQPKFRVLLAFWRGEPAAFAFFYYRYSTWLGRPGLWLEDLFVQPAMRRHGVGRALMRELARVALAENCYGINWQVLDWNQLAIDFYEKDGAEKLGEWLTFRLRGEALRRLAEGGTS